MRVPGLMGSLADGVGSHGSFAMHSSWRILIVRQTDKGLQ
jgi:hypothetical protein